MNRNETIQILKKINESYSTFFARKSQNEKNAIVNEWCNQFANDDFNVINERLNKYIITNKYAPKIADLKQIKKGFNNFNESENHSTDFNSLYEKQMMKYKKYLEMSEDELMNYIVQNGG